jgi:hypothetical protein
LNHKLHTNSTAIITHTADMKYARSEVATIVTVTQCSLVEVHR